LQFRHNEQIKKAVESGLGIGCLSEKVLGTNLESGNLVPLALPAGINLRRRFYLATLKDRYRSLGAQYWLRLCAAA
jgi:DNA-binding transcriptional LysR family regulator